MIIVFCVGLGTYFYVQRRKRIRNSRDEYEFEMLDDAELDGANGTGNGMRVKRRAGELYDAFAGESDEELLSDEEGEAGYRDEDPHPEEEQRGRSSSRE